MAGRSQAHTLRLAVIAEGVENQQQSESVAVMKFRVVFSAGP